MLKATSESSGADSNHATGLTANQKIDVCRGLFAFLVVAAHAVDIAWSLHPEAQTQYPRWLHDLLRHVAAQGIYWVIGFFVISGYCIQLSVSRSIDANPFQLMRYLAARLSRILPIYYLGLALAVVVEPLMAPARPPYWVNGINTNTLIAQLFLVQNMTETFGSYGPSWSITNEMFYYIFYGLIVCVAAQERDSRHEVGDVHLRWRRARNGGGAFPIVSFALHGGSRFALWFGSNLVLGSVCRRIRAGTRSIPFCQSGIV